VTELILTHSENILIAVGTFGLAVLGFIGFHFAAVKRIKEDAMAEQTQTLDISVLKRDLDRHITEDRKIDEKLTVIVRDVNKIDTRLARVEGKIDKNGGRS